MIPANHTSNYKPKLVEQLKLKLQSEYYNNKTIAAHTNDATTKICTQAINQVAGVISALDI